MDIGFGRNKELFVAWCWGMNEEEIQKLAQEKVSRQEYMCIMQLLLKLFSDLNITPLHGASFCVAFYMEATTESGIPKETAIDDLIKQLLIYRERKENEIT